MKLVNRNAKANLILSNLVFCAVIVFFYSCGSGGGSGSDGSSGMGSIAFELQFPNTANNMAITDNQINAAEFNCDANNVDEIVAQVVDEFDEILAEETFACEAGQGTITDLEAGIEVIVNITANDRDEEARFTGQSEPITILAGETVSAGTIELVVVGTVTFDFEEFTPTYVDEPGDEEVDPRPGALASLSSTKSGITIDIFRENNLAFDTGDNTSGSQIAKPVGFGDVSLDPFYDVSNSAFIVNFSIPVSSVSVDMGDYNTVDSDDPQDDDVLALVAYPLPDAAGMLLDRDQIDLPDAISPPNPRFSFETLFVERSGAECIRSILMIGGSAPEPGPNSVFYDNIVVETPCEPSTQAYDFSFSPTSPELQNKGKNVDNTLDFYTKEVGGGVSILPD